MDDAKSATRGPSGRWATVLVGLALFALALVPRTAALGTFISWDELFWTRAALKFNRELDGADWRDTYVIGQPGVVSMWLGTAGLRVAAMTGGTNWDETLEAGRLKYRDDDQATLRRLAQFWRLLPFTTALITALAIVGFWLLVRTPWGVPAATLAGVLLALDPFFIAHSRVMALDAVLASLVLLALTCLARFGRKLDWPALALSAMLTGLAVVQKVPSLVLAAWGLAVVIWVVARARGVKPAVLRGIAWLTVVGVVAVAAWPALWVEPVTTVTKIVDTLRTYEGSAYDSMYFLGQAGTPPGQLFYPTVLLYRASPLVLLGVALLAWRAVRRDRAVPWRDVVVFAGFSLAYGLVLSWPATKFDRYLLPATLPIVALAGLGWWHGLAIPRGWGARAGWSLVASIAALGALLLVPAIPADYLAWYNPLATVVRPAAEVLPQGWGEGMGHVVEFLAKDSTGSITVAAEGFASLATLPERVHLVRAAGESCRSADRIVVHAFDRQLARPVALAYADAPPLFVASAGGQPMAWVYAGGRSCEPDPASVKRTSVDRTGVAPYGP